MILKMDLIRATQSYKKAAENESDKVKKAMSLVDDVMAAYIESLYSHGNRRGRVLVALRKCLELDVQLISIVYQRLKSLYNALIMFELYELVKDMERLNAIVAVWLRASFEDVDDGPLRSLENLKGVEIGANKRKC